jgi:hypothetical protein
VPNKAVNLTRTVVLVAAAVWAAQVTAKALDRRDSHRYRTPRTLAYVHASAHLQASWRRMGAQ